MRDDRHHGRDSCKVRGGAVYHTALDHTGVAYFVSAPCFCQCLTRSSSERQLQLLCTVYGVIQQGDVPMSSMLQAMMERVLLPLASHCSSKALNDFFVAKVSDITALLLSRFTKVCFLRLSHGVKFVISFHTCMVIMDCTLFFNVLQIYLFINQVY